ncbi:AAA family ATPase [Burkholderia gladioli]|uniref:AAA family ATPase n=1 Tax=Burkholderia gladioli TaxID=28095 RepID=UPI001FC82CB0|nr:ATP-binding protein [Burkholderia gladioli]
MEKCNNRLEKEHPICGAACSKNGGAVIRGYSEDEFGTKLGTMLSASRPIHSIEYLKGRDKELETIKRSLYAPGRHVFIYGDRGVGKSSLGQTAAVQYQSASAAPVFVAGSPDDSFSTVIANIVIQALRQPRTESVKSIRSATFDLARVKMSAGTEISAVDIADRIKSIGDAVALLEEVAEKRPGNTAVVIDEFDAILDAGERNKFAALLKQMGDRSVNIKFIFTGVGKSLDELLGAHQSSYRQLEQVELPRLGWDARREIVQAAADAFEMQLDNDVNWRIAMVSDGFPYYVHLVTEKILWGAFSADQDITQIDSDLFLHGLGEAILSTVGELKRPYEKAVVHHPEMEDLVWATADHEDLIRSVDGIYQSYQFVVGRRADGRQPLERSRFAAQLRKLKGHAYGAVLTQPEGRQGLYTYREKMLRGYVRMQAEANGVALNGEQPVRKQAMHVGNARSGYRGPSIPRGVRTGKVVSEWDDSDS